jgi:nucleoside recognition membrane protein YjiH
LIQVTCPVIQLAASTTKATRCVAFVVLVKRRTKAYLRPFLVAFFSNISAFAARRFGDLYGFGFVFFFGLKAIIRVISA